MKQTCRKQAEMKETERSPIFKLTGVLVLAQSGGQTKGQVSKSPFSKLV